MKYRKIQKRSHVAGHQSASCDKSAINPIEQTTRLSVRVSVWLPQTGVGKWRSSCSAVHTIGATAVLAGLQEPLVSFECNMAQQMAALTHKRNV